MVKKSYISATEIGIFYRQVSGGYRLEQTHRDLILYLALEVFGDVRLSDLFYLKNFSLLPQRVVVCF